MPSFTCADCGTTFELPQPVLDRYPGWTPRQCRSCRDAGGGGRRQGAPKPPDTSPTDGVFTDGSADPNPGAGGWGAVWVHDGEVVDERSGGEPDTTNNRMELRALIEGARMVPEGTPAVLWSDSNLAVQTVNEWAAGWERRGWKRKTGPVQNLDLVQEAYRLLQARPELEVRWIKGHAGHEWNEHADRLANEGRDRHGRA
ncbi:MAG: ribonuclease H [Acidimicrobiia bacterium]